RAFHVTRVQTCALPILLGVPRVDPFQPIGSLHLWYLVEDPVSLHRLIVTTGADRWGNLRSLLDSTAGRLVDVEVRRRTEALADCARSALARLRIGRGRTVDAQAIADSGVVSSRFHDEVSALADSLDGDAVRLVQALKEKKVANFQQKNIRALHEYLEGKGYLDTRERMDVDTIRTEVIAESTRALEAGILSLEAIDRLRARLTSASESVPAPELQIRITGHS